MYILFILLIFLYPTILVNRRAKAIRDDVLQNYRQMYNNLLNKIENKDEISIKEISLMFLYKERFDSFKNLSLYPFQIEIFIKLISSVLLPFISIFVEKFLPKLF